MSYLKVAHRGGRAMGVLTDELRQQLPPIHARNLRLGSPRRNGLDYRTKAVLEGE
jgi:hypothetical protein